MASEARPRSQPGAERIAISVRAITTAMRSSTTRPMMGSPMIPRSRTVNEMRAALNTTTPAPTPASAARTARQGTGAVTNARSAALRANRPRSPGSRCWPARPAWPHPAIPRPMRLVVSRASTARRRPPRGLARDPPRDDRRSEREDGPVVTKGDELERARGRILPGARGDFVTPTTPKVRPRGISQSPRRARHTALAATPRRRPRETPPRQRAGRREVRRSAQPRPTERRTSVRCVLGDRGPRRSAPPSTRTRRVQ